MVKGAKTNHVWSLLTDETSLLGAFDHGEGDAILDGLAEPHPLEFGEDEGATGAAEEGVGDAEEGRVADQIGDGVLNAVREGGGDGVGAAHGAVAAGGDEAYPSPDYPAPEPGGRGVLVPPRSSPVKAE